MVAANSDNSDSTSQCTYNHRGGARAMCGCACVCFARVITVFTFPNITTTPLSPALSSTQYTNTLGTLSTPRLRPSKPPSFLLLLLLLLLLLPWWLVHVLPTAPPHAHMRAFTPSPPRLPPFAVSMNTAAATTCAAAAHHCRSKERHHASAAAAAPAAAPCVCVCCCVCVCGCGGCGIGGCGCWYRSTIALAAASSRRGSA